MTCNGLAIAGISTKTETVNYRDTPHNVYGIGWIIHRASREIRLVTPWLLCPTTSACAGSASVGRRTIICPCCLTISAATPQSPYPWCPINTCSGVLPISTMTDSRNTDIDPSRLSSNAALAGRYEPLFSSKTIHLRGMRRQSSSSSLMLRSSAMDSANGAYDKRVMIGWSGVRLLTRRSRSHSSPVSRSSNDT